MANPISLIITDSNGNSLQVTGATILTPAQRHALGIMLSQPISAVLTDHSGNPLQLSSGSSGTWASLTGDLTETQVIPWDGGTVGTPDSGISRIGVDSLAIGDGTTGDTSGTLTLSSLYASLVDTVAVTLTGVFTDGVGSVGTNGQVLSSTVSGTKWINAAASGVTSITGDGTILSNSGSTGAVTLTLENAGQNTVLAGPTSGGSGAPTYRSLVAADLPAGVGVWSSLTNPTANLSLTMGTDTTTFNYATGLAAAWAWQNNTPTVTGASTTLALSTSTAPTHSGGSWTYTLAATESGAGSNAWVGASVTTSGWTGGATGNNGTFTITASTTTTVTVQNATGTTINTGTPVMISSTVSNSPVLQIAGTVNTGTAGTLNSVADVWSIQNVLGSVEPNPTSTLTFTHSGSSGVAAVSVPQLVITTASGTISGNSCVLAFASGVTYVQSSGTTNLALNKNSTFSVLNLINTGGLSWASGSPASTLADTTITRNAAGIVQIGTTGSNASGFLATGTLSPTSAATAGVTGQWAWDATNLYICTAGGIAGSATWKKVALSSD